ncbi:hypothetical protein BGZ74_011031 [Mortierella antarctica]|nr:hypothetical protein BGZ74_011031 [Mortierella antarctica]
MLTSTSPIDKVFYGTIIHSLSLRQIEYIRRGLLIVDALGVIVRMDRNVAPNQLDRLLADVSRENVIVLNDDQFIIPGLIDTHIHAPQYSYCGNGHDISLLRWLDTLIFPYESEFKDPSHARHIYTKSVARSLRNGTTSACWFATIHLEATKELVNVIREQGQRAYVGKVNMNQNSPASLTETTESSVTDTRAFIEYVQTTNSTGPSELATEYNLPIQSHLCETPHEIAFTRSLFPGSADYTSIYADHGLLTDRSIMAHCVHITDQELAMMKDRNAGVSHCPNSNFTIRSGMAHVRRMLDMDIKVALGTDVAGGTSPSILEALRSACTCSVAVDAETTLRVPELFYLATMGGARVMGLEATVGNFAVGKEFDAVLVNTAVENSPLDAFEHDSVESMFEKYLFMGDDRNNEKVYVQGKEVRFPGGGAGSGAVGSGSGSTVN